MQDDLPKWAREFTAEHKESVEYFLRFGSPVERALISKVVELAEEAQ